MGQQNQQPSQQEQHERSSTKNFLANPKLPLIAAAVVVIAVILAVAGILLMKAMTQTPSSVPQAVPIPILEEQSYGCKIDNDCVLVQDG